MIEQIENKCDEIKIIKISEKVEENNIQEQLNKNKYYIKENKIIAYPIERKILYAIERISNNNTIINDKYGESSILISQLINEGRNQDRIEVLRDFNGWSWTTLKNEIENIEANLVYQTLRLLFGEEFLEKWINNKNVIIDYWEILDKEATKKFGKDNAIKLRNSIEKIAIANNSTLKLRICIIFSPFY